MLGGDERGDAQNGNDTRHASQTRLNYRTPSKDGVAEIGIDFGLQSDADTDGL